MQEQIPSSQEALRHPGSLVRLSSSFWTELSWEKNTGFFNREGHRWEIPILKKLFQNYVDAEKMSTWTLRVYLDYGPLCHLIHTKLHKDREAVWISEGHWASRGSCWEAFPWVDRDCHRQAMAWKLRQCQEAASAAWGTALDMASAEKFIANISPFHHYRSTPFIVLP